MTSVATTMHEILCICSRTDFTWHSFTATVGAPL